MLEQRFHCSWWKDHDEVGISLQSLEMNLPEQIPTLHTVQDLIAEQQGIS